jgi:hypothetical protein
VRGTIVYSQLIVSPWPAHYNPSSPTHHFATKCFYILYSIVIISEGDFYIPATPSLLHKLEWLEKAGVVKPMSGFIVQLECEWF